MARTLHFVAAALAVFALTPTGYADLLVGSSSTRSIFRFDDTSETLLGEFVTPDSGGLNYAFGMDIGPDGNLYVSSRFTRDVIRYDGQTGAFLDIFVPAGTGGLGLPHGLTFGSDGNLYVVSNSSHSVRRFDGTTGAFIDVFASGGLSFPTDICFGPSGDLYVSSSFNNQVLRYDGSTGANLGTFASGGISNCQGLAFSPLTGNLCVASYDGDRVLQFDGVTGASMGTFVSAGSGGLNSPVDLEFGPNGDLYAVSAAGGSNQVLRFDGTTGAFVGALAGSGGGQGYLLFADISLSTGSPYCAGDGSGAACPCGAAGNAGEGCRNSAGTGATLVAAGNAAVSNDTFQLDVTGVPGAKPGLLLRGDNQTATPAGDGILCTSGGSLRSQVQITVAGATTFTEFNAGGMGSGAPFGSSANLGVPTNYQFWYRDPSNSCSGAGFNFTNAWTVTWTP